MKHCWKKLLTPQWTLKLFKTTLEMPHNASFYPPEKLEISLLSSIRLLSHHKSLKSLSHHEQTNNRSKQAFLHSDTVSWLHKRNKNSNTLQKCLDRKSLAFEAVSVLCVWCGETQTGVNRFQIPKPNLTHNYMAWKANGRTRNTRIIYHCSPFFHRLCPPVKFFRWWGVVH